MGLFGNHKDWEDYDIYENREWERRCKECNELLNKHVKYCPKCKRKLYQFPHDVHIHFV